jgi:hypothetical protein
MTRETVWVDTPAALATCFIVERRFVFIKRPFIAKNQLIVTVPDNDNMVTNLKRFVK